MAQGEVIVRRGLSEDLRDEAVAIYLEAFWPKLAPLAWSRERAALIVREGLRAENALVALRDGRLMGLAGLQEDGRPFFDPQQAAFVRAFGWLRGPIKWRLYGFFSTVQVQGLYLSSLAVRRDARGQGVGTRLLEETMRVARENGSRQVVLHVVDTNPGAIRLYARMGYAIVKTRRYPCMRWIAGFTAVHTMARRVDQEETAWV